MTGRHRHRSIGTSARGWVLASALALAATMAATVAVAQEQPNPFFAGSSRASGADNRAGWAAPELITNAVSVARTVERTANERVSALMRGAVAATGLGPWIALLVVAFTYGLLHSLAPGHGKSLVVSYFLSTDARPVHGVIAGAAMALVHVGIVCIIIVGGYIILETTLGQVLGDATQLLRKVSAVLLFALGGRLLFLRARGALRMARGHHVGADHGHEHRGLAHDHVPDGASDGASQGSAVAVANRVEPARVTTAGLTSLVLGGGLSPCSGAALLLLFSISLGVISVGIAAAASLAVGMALTQIAVALLTIAGKRKLMQTSGTQGGLPEWLHIAVEGLAALFILALAVWLVV